MTVIDDTKTPECRMERQSPGAEGAGPSYRRTCREPEVIVIKEEAEPLSHHFLAWCDQQNSTGSHFGRAGRAAERPCRMTVVERSWRGAFVALVRVPRWTGRKHRLRM
jgi:hypothetical protein